MKHDLECLTDRDLKMAGESSTFTETFKEDVRTEQHRRLPLRWYDITGTTRGRDGKELDTCREYATSADEAMSQAFDHAAGTRFTPEIAKESPHNPKEPCHDR